MKGEHAITTWEMQMGVVAFIGKSKCQLERYSGRLAGANILDSAYNLIAILGVKLFLRTMAYEVFLISHVVLVL